MKYYLLFFLAALPILIHAQRIAYSEPNKADKRLLGFQVIGKTGDHTLVYKKYRESAFIAVYNNEMIEIGKTIAGFLPGNCLDISFIDYPDFCYLVYEYQENNTIHRSAVKLDNMGKNIGNPVDLAIVKARYAAIAKLFTTVVSDDKKYIMLIKVSGKNAPAYTFNTILFDNNLHLIDSGNLQLPLENKNEIITHFFLDNDGQLVFAKFLRTENGEYISNVSLVLKGALSDSLELKHLDGYTGMLDELKIKIDNLNKRYILTGFYYKDRSDNIEGLFSVYWDKTSGRLINETQTVFDDHVRLLVKNAGGSLKTAFDDFFIRNIIAKKEGGYIITAESESYEGSRYPFNRWNYIFGDNNYITGSSRVIYRSGNIIIFSFDKNNKIEWDTLIPKKQLDLRNPSFLSYHLLNAAGQLHFLYNEYEHNTLVLSDKYISAGGNVSSYPIFKNMDKGYEFMIRNAKQIDEQQLVIPCTHKDIPCFALLDFTN